jgi:hypothetical protein
VLTAEAEIRTAQPGRYLVQLCRHAQHLTGRAAHLHGRARGPRPELRHVEWSDSEGLLVLGWGRCVLRATPETLVVRAEAADTDSLRRLQDLVTSRLESFGRREGLAVRWRETGGAPG